MKKEFLTIILSFIGATTILASDYEKGMLKGKEMFNNAKTLDETINVTNYFERIAEANKGEWLPLYYAAYSCLSAGFQQDKTDAKDECYQKGLEFIEKAKSIKKAESELQPCVVFTVKSAVGCANDFKLKNMQIHTHTMML